MKRKMSTRWTGVNSLKMILSLRFFSDGRNPSLSIYFRRSSFIDTDITRVFYLLDKRRVFQVLECCRWCSTQMTIQLIEFTNCDLEDDVWENCKNCNERHTRKGRIRPYDRQPLSSSSDYLTSGIRRLDYNLSKAREFVSSSRANLQTCFAAFSRLEWLFPLNKSNDGKK